ncbi:hypothetical protein, partial [Aeromonas caviae]|uniref:hypothetical protein n=1 Tax=Aeromonas caviae TaxID=648 RepID=UPI001CC715B1
MFRLNRNERSHWSGNGVHVESELVFMIGRNMQKGIKLAQALDIMAELNGISGGWHNAMQQLNNKLQPS